MLNQLFNSAKNFRTIRCTEVAQLSPTTRISPAHRATILLKVHAPQNDERTTNQKVASSTLAGRTISSYCPHLGLSCFSKPRFVVYLPASEGLKRSISGCSMIDSMANPTATTGKKITTLVINWGMARSSQNMADK